MHRSQRCVGELLRRPRDAAGPEPAVGVGLICWGLIGSGLIGSGLICLGLIWLCPDYSGFGL
jgi:hypothetical protein